MSKHALKIKYSITTEKSFTKKYLFSFVAYGHSYNGERFIPVLLKDVAGLVPGACQGKGRGNRYVIRPVYSLSSPNMIIIFLNPDNLLGSINVYFGWDPFTFLHCCFRRFLNDLLVADVLMHIVDVSGCTDQTGEQTTGYDPSLDVAWLQEEIQ